MTFTPKTNGRSCASRRPSVMTTAVTSNMGSPATAAVTTVTAVYNNEEPMATTTIADGRKRSINLGGFLRAGQR